MAHKEIQDSGVLTDSYIYAHIPSPFAQNALYYLLYAGELRCDTRYCIERQHLNMYLLVYVVEGGLRCQFGGNTLTVGPGELILMDCRQHHICQSIADNTHFRWFYFNGASSPHYYDLIDQRHNLVTTASETTLHNLESILNMMKEDMVDEHQASVLIHKMLWEIATDSSSKDFRTNRARQVLSYIHSNYQDDIMVEQLANIANLSPYHFIRWFKHLTSTTPHEYLINYRLKKAKELLINTDDSIEQIACQCGFNSASHFCRCFKKEVGVTPREFRHLF
jgi:AraC-like DNA-binding protein